ncbi:MAG: SH3 domain-containing protein [Desulfovibrio sp.]|nr:MAG: SH3 domain-containing protein [Desulfovibrio sp.]
MKHKLVPMMFAMMALLLFAVGCSVSVDVDPPPPSGYDRQVVDTDSLNVRSCPSMECDVVTVVHRGQWVRVYEYRDGWARVKVRDTNVEGWCASQYLDR